MQRKEIYTVTYDVNSSHTLDPETIYKFTLDDDLRVIGVGTRPEDSLYDIYITYKHEGDNFQVGKVLKVNIEDTTTAKMYNFMSSKTSSQGNTIDQRIFKID